MLNMLAKRKGIFCVALVVLLVALMLPISIDTQPGGVVTITIGHIAHAAGVADYTCDGTDDDVQIQAAMNALPAGGGRLVLLTGTYSFSATVTRAIANVTVEGTGRSTYITNDGATPLFTAGNSNWVFSNLRTDAGGINMGATAGWMWTNVTINATYYAYYSPYGNTEVDTFTADNITNSSLTNTRVTFAGAGGLLTDDADLTFSGTTLTVTDLETPTGTGATFIVASSTANARSIAQADYVCDGTADEVQINAAIAALPALGGEIKLTEGTFTLANAAILDITNGNGGIHISGVAPEATVVYNGNVGGGNAFEIGTGAGDAIYWAEIDHMTIIGNAASGDGIYLNVGTIPFCSIHHCVIEDNGGYGIAPNLAINFQKIRIDQCWIDDNDTGGIQTNFAGWRITNCDIWRNNGYGIDATVGQEHYISDCNLEDNDDFAVAIRNGVVTNTMFSDIFNGGVYAVGASSGVVITDNDFGNHTSPNDPLIQLNEAGCYVGTNRFLSLQQNAVAIEVNARNCMIMPQMWGDSDHATAVRVDTNGYRGTYLGNQYDSSEGQDRDRGLYNFVGNGNFEPNLGTSGWSAQDGCTLTVDTGTVAVGAQSLEMNTNGADYAEARYTIWTKPEWANRWITMGAWIYLPSTNTLEQARLRLMDNASNTVVLSEVTPKDDAWHWVTVSLKVPDTPPTNFRASLYGNYGTVDADDIIYWDGVIVCEGATCPAYSPQPVMLDYPDDILQGEPRWATGSLTAGNANAICFAWNNPEREDILIKKVVIETTTAGGTVGSNLDVGIADDATGTNRGTEFFDDLDLNSTQVHGSLDASTGGTQTVSIWVVCQDIASATDDWVVGQILDANAASLVGRYYIEYIGRN